MNRPRLKFFREWVRNPKRTGAFLPSGKALANLLTADLGPNSGRVVELGPGTGVVTSAILERGVRPERLTLVELNPDFAHHLRHQFPRVRVLNVTAESICDHLPPGNDPAAGPLSAVISGLPFMTIPNPIIERILDSAFRLMCPGNSVGGQFVLFTYGPRLPVSQKILDHLHLRAVRRGTAMGNLPPASVYVLTRVHKEQSP